MNYNTDEVVMIRPAKFGFNEQTAENNIYQHKNDKDASVINEKALAEFDNLVNELIKKGVKVNVIQDTLEPKTPDSIFPNNWFSTHRNGELIIYPMFAQNRRMEIVKHRQKVQKIFENKLDKKANVIDYSNRASDNTFLEGTGSIVIDRVTKTAYMALSPRSDEKLFREFCEKTSHKPVVFRAVHKGVEIYHTNVLMGIGEKYALVCFEVIESKYREDVRKSLEKAGKHIIELSVEQFESYAGNTLELKGKDGSIIAMSQSSYDSLTKGQIQKLERYCDIVSVDVSTIEYYGGGSVRCMLAEIYN